VKAYRQLDIIKKQLEEIEPLVTMKTGDVSSLHQVEWYLMQALRDIKNRSEYSEKDKAAPVNQEPAK
jgi:hypothetical protein